ncbi:class I SAM-dependent methyltransferase [Luteimonas sp. e5]
MWLIFPNFSCHGQRHRLGRSPYASRHGQCERQYDGWMAANNAQTAGAEAWAELWRRGVLHSCASSIDGNYDGAIAAFWSSCFDPLLAGDRLVDLGTGNGALALLAKAHATRQGFSLDIHGVDLADIRPAENLADGARLLDGIRFHPCTDMRQLPFEDGSVTLLTSQYGFEYAASREVVTEMARVLAADGRVCMLMHSDDSLIARTAPAQQQGIDYLLQSPLVSRLSAIAQLIAAAPDAGSRAALARSPNAEETRHAFNASVDDLLTHQRKLPDAHVLAEAAWHVRRILEVAQQGHAARAVAYLEDWTKALAAERMRLQDLAAALLSPKKLAQIRMWLEEHGMSVETGTLRQATDAPMGWTLVARHG